MKVLVTGHLGYIGVEMVSELRRAGHEVVGLDAAFFDQCDFRAPPDEVELVGRDLRDVTPEQLEGVDAVAHLGALSNDPLGDLNPRLTYDINLDASVRLAKADTIRASELQNIRAFGSESDLQTVQQEVATRMARLRNDLELTLENHRLGAIQGIVVDADGTTPLVDWYSEWAISQAAEIDFALGTSGTDVRGKCGQVKRQMMVAAKGAWLPGTQIYGLASDGFFDALSAGPVSATDPRVLGGDLVTSSLEPRP